jgi:hypothetical protein
MLLPVIAVSTTVALPILRTNLDKEIENSFVIARRAPCIQKTADERLDRLPLGTKLIFVDAGKAQLECADPKTGKGASLDLPESGHERDRPVKLIQNGTCQVRFQK